MGARNPGFWDSDVGPSGYRSQKGLAGEAGYVGAGDGAVEADRGLVVSWRGCCVEGSDERQGVARGGRGAKSEIVWNCEDSYSR